MLEPTLLISLAVAAVMISFGLSQFLHPEGWRDYIPSRLRGLLPTSPETTMRLHSLGNIFFGLFLATQLYPLVAAWIAFIWFLTILPFAYMYKWQIGARDTAITLSLLALILLLG